MASDGHSSKTTSLCSTHATVPGTERERVDDWSPCQRPDRYVGSRDSHMTGEIILSPRRDDALSTGDGEWSDRTGRHAPSY